MSSIETMNEFIDENPRTNHDGSHVYHYLGELCPEKIWEAFEEELRVAGIKVLFGNASAGINYEGVTLLNKSSKITVSEDKLVTAGLYYTLNKILLDLLASGHNCISVRQPLHVRNFMMDGNRMYRVYIRYLTGRNIDEETFKQAVMLASPSWFQKMWE